ncbi:unnamed protein product [Prorocentrum cordatum]|uniref:Reverse transcriptase Ty1/copia-type domain-containing protein n=1 Tax=Prorocentrum cordatum TaxID=2364126 RepID=A0ABN9WWC7_9DINO|nr:unnamed protein product [Polarella glacialis]
MASHTREIKRSEWTHGGYFPLGRVAVEEGGGVLGWRQALRALYVKIARSSDPPPARAGNRALDSGCGAAPEGFSRYFNEAWTLHEQWEQQDSSAAAASAGAAAAASAAQAALAAPTGGTAAPAGGASPPEAGAAEAALVDEQGGASSAAASAGQGRATGKGTKRSKGAQGEAGDGTAVVDPPKETAAQKRARLERDQQGAAASSGDAVADEKKTAAKLAKDGKDALQRYSNTTRQANHMVMNVEKQPTWAWASRDQEFIDMKELLTKITHDVMTSTLLSSAVSVDWPKLKAAVGAGNYKTVLTSLVGLTSDLSKIDGHLKILLGSYELRQQREAERLKQLQSSCRACEIVVLLNTAEHKTALLRSLKWSQPPKKIGGRLIFTDAVINGVRLGVGDRLAPSPELLDIAKLEELDVPTRVIFWRATLDGDSPPKVMDPVSYRCPFFDRDLRTSPAMSLAVDSLHTISLGVGMRWLSAVMWRVLFRNPWRMGGSSAEQILISGVGVLNAELERWQTDPANAVPSFLIFLAATRGVKWAIEQPLNSIFFHVVTISDDIFKTAAERVITSAQPWGAERPPWWAHGGWHVPRNPLPLHLWEASLRDVPPLGRARVPMRWALVAIDPCDDNKPATATLGWLDENGFNRTLLEGALALLAMAAFPVTWRPLALTMWCMMHNGFKIGKDGFTPYFRRFGRHPEFRQCPFGALVFVAPREKGVKQPRWQEKMLPYVLAGIGIGPFFDWNKTYAVVPLRRLLGDYRPSRSSIRYSAEVFFPERVTFPAKQRNEYDGELAENAPKLVPGNFVEDIVLDPENLADSGGDQDDWLGADAQFIAEDVLAGMGPEPEPLDEAEVKAAGGRPPTGWRIDTFGSRAVSVPPWSRRPPTVYPEAWVMMSKGDQNKLRDEWKEKDPDGFKKQVPLRSRRRHGPGVGDPGRLRQHGQRMPPNSLTNNQKQFQHLGTLAIRLAEETDLTLKETRRALHGVVREAYLNGCAIYVWASTPSTAGSPRQHVDAGPGGARGDVDLSDKLIQTTISICRHAARYGGWIFWERPPTSKFWHRQDVIDFAQYLDAGSRDVSTAALGMKFVVKRGGQEIEQYLKQKWRIMSNHAEFLRRLEPYQDVPDLPEDSFIECTGKIAKDSANYTRELAEVFWSIVKVVPSLDHRDDGVGAEPPVWSCLITRKINLKSAEARSEAALKAIEKELAGHRSRQTWSETEVREYKDLMKDPTIPEVLHGRVFGIMGEKNAEGDDASIKFRAVFQGSQVRTKTGVDAVDLYQEVSSSPVSFAAVRCTLAIAVLLQLQVSVCDALQAYLQASISGPGRVPTWVEIPREWWPSSWYHNGDRSRPRFVRPVCLLLRALYGHPEAGALWEHLFEGILKALHWEPVASWPGVFLHPDGSILNVYVDDVLLAAAIGRAAAHWRDLFKAIDFKDDAADISRFVGAHYLLDPFREEEPLAARRMQISMSGHTAKMCDRFVADTGIALNRAVDTPYLSNEAWNDDNEQTGKFAPIAPSHAASALFLYRVGRPDIAAATQRLCSKVFAWTVVHDKALIRLMLYAACTAKAVLRGALSPSDLATLLLVCYSDADLNGNSETTKSVSGWWVELFSPESGNTFPLSWGVSTQTSTSSATAESETVAFSHALRREAIPLQMLLEEAFGQHIHIVCRIDNMQTIQCVAKGYSKKLRHLPRTQRICLGVLHEMVTNPDLRIAMEHCPTLAMKADLFTKTLNSARYATALDMIGLDVTDGRYLKRVRVSVDSHLRVHFGTREAGDVHGAAGLSASWVHSTCTARMGSLPQGVPTACVGRADEETKPAHLASTVSGDPLQLSICQLTGQLAEHLGAVPPQGREPKWTVEPWPSRASELRPPAAAPAPQAAAADAAAAAAVGAEAEERPPVHTPEHAEGVPAGRGDLRETMNQLTEQLRGLVHSFEGGGAASPEGAASAPAAALEPRARQPRSRASS